MTTSKTGPKWSTVSWRKTVCLDTSKVIENKKVENLILVNQGCLHIYGYYVIKDEEMLRFKAVTIPKGSWYGDY